MQRVIYSLVILICVFTTVGACVDHDLDDFGDCANVSYVNDVQPIITAKCSFSGCHDASVPDRNWNVLGTLQSKAAVVKDRVLNGSMPPAGAPGGDLTDDQLNTLICWIDAGAPNN